MPQWSTSSLFVAAAAILVAVPGPNSFYIIARSPRQGFAAGIVSSPGIPVGTVLHISAAAVLGDKFKQDLTLMLPKPEGGTP